MLFDPLILGNAGLFAAVFGLSMLDFDEVFSSDDDDDDSIAPVGPGPGELVVERVTGTQADDEITARGDGPGIFDLLGGDDTLDASDFADTIRGRGGDDDIFARGGDDLVDLGDGDDRGWGGDGDDRIAGGSGSDRVSGQAGDDVLTGGMGDDTVTGGDGEDIVYGGTGADILSGGDGDDILNGTWGDTTRSETSEADLADTLDGGDGDDRLILGTGDEGTGGNGADTFVIDEYVVAQGLGAGNSGGPARITDFDPGEDVLAVEYDADAGDGTVAVTPLPDDSGVTVTLDGVDVAIVSGNTGLSADQVQLLAI